MDKGRVLLHWVPSLLYLNKTINNPWVILAAQCSQSSSSVERKLLILIYWLCLEVFPVKAGWGVWVSIGTNEIICINNNLSHGTLLLYYVLSLLPREASIKFEPAEAWKSNKKKERNVRLDWSTDPSLFLMFYLLSWSLTGWWWRMVTGDSCYSSQ